MTTSEKDLLIESFLDGGSGCAGLRNWGQPISPYDRGETMNVAKRHWDELIEGEDQKTNSAKNSLINDGICKNT